MPTGPEEDILKAALVGYAAERLSIKFRLVRLKEEYGLYASSERTLHKLNKHFNMPSVRRNKLPQDLADQLVLNKMSDLNDSHGRWGVQRTMSSLAQDGTPVPRRTIREVMQLNEPNAVDEWYPGKKKIPRAKLNAIGPFHEINCDGHDKLGSLALKMGPIGIPIYGMKDKWSGAILHLVVVPNNRLATTIGHVYLGFAESFGAIPVQITVDKGSETGEMYGFQTALRQTFAPELDEEQVPSFVALTSTHNIPIEGAWHWFREQTSRTLFSHIKKGEEDGIFNPNNEIHIKLFNWIWPPVIQHELDQYRESWNKHTIRAQHGKLMPSGSTPTMFFKAPSHFGGTRVSIEVTSDVLQALREGLSVSRSEAFRWVDEAFSVAAQFVYEDLHKPPIDLGTAWSVFETMAPHLIDIVVVD
ncbi:hypothetical protein B0H21DRAFT_701959 [Amylocystis lapponica]|nr:hypothetical protein B0H21DRAFT_701959 [Amylocystis lapponica]